jgi:hypothetical protein
MILIKGLLIVSIGISFFILYSGSHKNYQNKLDNFIKNDYEIEIIKSKIDATKESLKSTPQNYITTKAKLLKNLEMYQKEHTDKFLDLEKSKSKKVIEAYSYIDMIFRGFYLLVNIIFLHILSARIFSNYAINS